MKIKENDMSAVVFVGSPSSLSSPCSEPLAAFPKWLASVPGFRSAGGLASVSMGALWGGCDDASGPVRVWGMVKGFRMWRSLPLGGAMPFAVFPEEAETLEGGGIRKHSQFNENTQRMQNLGLIIVHF